MGSGNEEPAWRRACNSVTFFFAVPIALVTLGLTTVLYWATGLGTHFEHRRWSQFAAVAIGLVLVFILDRRFRRFRTYPPKLGLAEPRADAALVFSFRALSVAIIIAIWLIGLVLRKSGSGVLNGF